MSLQQRVHDPLLVDDWHPISASDALAEGSLGKARLLGEDLVLWRHEGRANVWQDLCAHRGTRLTLGRIEGDNLVCGYHGWRYGDDGQCVMFPAHPDQKPPPSAHIKTYACLEKYGLVWASLGDPKRSVPEFREWEDSSFRKVFGGPYVYNASATRAVENFLDIAHFPFVHAGLLGDEAHAKIGDYQVRSDSSGIEATGVRVWQPDPDGTGVGKEVVYTYRVLRPFTAYLLKETGQGAMAIQLNVTPVDEMRSIGWMWMAINYAHDEPIEDLAAFQDKIVSQDIPVVESQRPELLPLDLQAELHLRSDRLAVAYRKWLGELGLTFGTA